MRELDPRVRELSEAAGGNDHLPYFSCFCFGYPQLEKLHDLVVQAAYDDMRTYIRWALMNAIDDEKIKTEIMLDIMSKFENKYERLNNGT
jgi:hypothetical protein